MWGALHPSLIGIDEIAERVLIVRRGVRPERLLSGRGKMSYIETILLFVISYLVVYFAGYMRGVQDNNRRC